VGASVWGMLGQVGLYCEVCYFYGVSVAHLRRLTWFGVGGWVVSRKGVGASMTLVVQCCNLVVVVS